MTNLEIIKELNQLNLQINNLISLLSEQPVINNSEITENNINDKTSAQEFFLGTEFQGNDSLLESNTEIPEGEPLEETAAPSQEMIVDDGEELILE